MSKYADMVGKQVPTEGESMRLCEYLSRQLDLWVASGNKNALLPLTLTGRELALLLFSLSEGHKCGQGVARVTRMLANQETVTDFLKTLLAEKTQDEQLLFLRSVFAVLLFGEDILKKEE